MSTTDNDVSSILHRHISLLYIVVILLFLLIILGGVFAYNIYEKEVARAMAAEKTATDAQNLMLQFKEASDKDLIAAQQRIQDDDKQRALDQQHIITLEQTIKNRDAQTQIQINSVLAA